MFKFVNGFTGKVKGHSLLDPIKVTVATSVMGLFIVSWATLSEVGVMIVIGLSTLGAYAATSLFNYEKNKQIESMMDDLKLNDEIEGDTNKV